MSKYFNILGVIVLFSLIAFGFYFWFVASQKPSLPPSPVSPSSTQPEANFPKNPSTFKISGGGGPPYFLEITFDPFHSRGGEVQRLIVALEDEISISKVWAEVEDEIGKEKVNLTLLKKENSKTFWQGEWKVRVTKEKEYPVTFFAENERGEKSQITLLWLAKEGGKLKEQGVINILKYSFSRLKKEFPIQKVLADWVTSTTCTHSDQFPHAGSCTLQATILLRGITGIDGGSLTIAPGHTLQLADNTTFVFNPGENISPIGAVALSANNAQIIKNYLWIRDNDNDRCGVFTTPSNDNFTGDVRYGTTSPGSGWKRVKDISYWPDPNDNNPGPPPSCVGISPPSAPTVSCTTISSSRIDVSWTDVANETGYRIYRCTGSGCTATTEVHSTGANVTFWSNTGLTADTTYGYRVRAYNAGGESPWRNTVYCTTEEPPAGCPPSRCTASISCRSMSDAPNGFLCDYCWSNCSGIFLYLVYPDGGRRYITHYFGTTDCGEAGICCFPPGTYRIIINECGRIIAQTTWVSR